MEKQGGYSFKKDNAIKTILHFSNFSISSIKRLKKQIKEQRKTGKEICISHKILTIKIHKNMMINILKKL